MTARPRLTTAEDLHPRPAYRRGLFVLLFASCTCLLALAAPRLAAEESEPPPAPARAAGASAPALAKSDGPLVIGKYAATADSFVDADTLRLPDGKPSVRILGIDAEETFKSRPDRAAAAADFDAYAKAKRGASARPVKYGTPAGEAARDYVKSLMKDVTQVRLERDRLGGRESGTYGRTLAHVFLLAPSGEINLSAAIIRAGHSPYFMKYGRSVRFDALYQAAEKEARLKQRGIWSEDGPRHYPDYDERCRWWSARAAQVKAWSTRASKPGRVTLGEPGSELKLAALVGSEAVVFGLLNREIAVKAGDRHVLLLSHVGRRSFALVVFDEAVYDALDMKTYAAMYLTLILALGVVLGTMLNCGCGKGPGAEAELTEVDLLARAVSHIVLPVKRDQPDGRARKAINEAYRRVLQGEDFAAIAKGRSKDGSAKDGGFLGFIRTQYDTAFAGAVQALRPGEMSPPLRTDMGWHILKRHTFEEGRALERRYWIPTLGFFVPWEGIQGGEPGRTRAEARTLAVEARAQLGRGAWTLAEAAARFSPSLSHGPEAFVGLTADRPGQEGVFAALSSSRVGEILDPLETPQGWAVFVRGRYLRSLVKHILVQHIGSEERGSQVRRTREEAAAVAERALAEVLKNPARWDAVVARDSDDVHSLENGGTMGVLTPGAMPTGFEEVIYDIPAGAFAKHPIETPFGFHVVWKVN